MEYTFQVAQDPDYPDCWSVYLTNSSNSGAEIAGKIHYEALANKIAANLNELAQAQIALIFELPYPL